MRGPAREAYTLYPRPVLWLVPEGEVRTPRGAVTVAPFYLSTVPVTNRQLEAFDPTYRRSAAAPDDDDPALGVSWRDALAYCAWYGRVARKAIRLPDEWEWERASGAATAAGWRNDPAAAEPFVWHAGNSDPARVPRLDGKRANELGLHAMVGGVWEWVAPTGAGGSPCLRGGSWRTALAEALAGRRELPVGERPADAGFRIAKSLRG